MSDTTDKVTIVGGGDSGLLTALCLQQANPRMDISIIDNFRRDTPQVGKSTFYKIYGILHDVLDIDRERFTREVRPIWKCSVYFRDWCGLPPFHYPFDNPSKFPGGNTPDAVGPLYHYYDEGYRTDFTLHEKLVAAGKSPWFIDPSNGSGWPVGYQIYTPIAYHLDLERFNDFLRRCCRERDISLIDDEIVEVEFDGNRIEAIRSKRQRYEADLYVDASGFNRVLQENLDGTFKEFDLPLDSAYNTLVERPLSEVVPATVVESGTSGWFWEIDTFDRRDYGYVYASEFTSDDEALAEFLDHCPADVTESDVASYGFSSGYYGQPWAENHLVIGNAGGFVEPLESTGLTFNAEAAIHLANLLSTHQGIVSDAVRGTYNTWWQRCWESIYDFVAIHYAFAPGETPFWERMQSMDLSRRNERIVETYDAHGFDTIVPAPTETGTEVEPLLVFDLGSFYTLMRSMGRTSDFYESHEFDLGEEVRQRSERFHQGANQQVERNHITTEEFYRGVIEVD